MNHKVDRHGKSSASISYPNHRYKLLKLPVVSLATVYLHLIKTVSKVCKRPDPYSTAPPSKTRGLCSQSKDKASKGSYYLISYFIRPAPSALRPFFRRKSVTFISEHGNSFRKRHSTCLNFRMKLTS